MAISKTNAMRILDAQKVHYEILSYDNKNGKIDGVSVANKIDRDIRLVYKTLVTQGNSKDLYIFIIPVEEELDLKKAAKLANEKKMDMIAVKDIQKWTGYIRGGCSPIGMKKTYPTFIDQSAENLEKMIVSGGKIGVQIEIDPYDLIEVIEGEFATLIKNEG
jgi:Cys-tRNA(Pro)/Cys-tRNA(Cys) deacylase